MSYTNEMGDSQSLGEVHQDTPRMEPWIIVSLLAFVPVLALFILPNGAMTSFCIGAAAVLLASGMGMLVRSEWRRNRR